MLKTVLLLLAFRCVGVCRANFAGNMKVWNSNGFDDHC